MAGLAASPTHPHVIRRRRVGRAVALLALALLVVVGALRHPASPLTRSAAGGGASIRLWVADGRAGRVLTPLDPVTLGDVADPPPLDLGMPYWIVSADGSTLATIAYARHAGATLPPDQVTIHIRDGRSGAERARFHPPEHVVSPRLSADGTRLVVEGRQDGGGPRPATWYVLDSGDGQVLATVRGAGSNGWPSWLDPAARRLYHLVTPLEAEARAPRPAHFVAYDLQGGGELGRLELPAVRAGLWRTERTITVQRSTVPVMAHLTPGVALSPDGQRLAVVDADADTVTLIDTERFAVERVLTLARPTGLPGALWARLGLAPQVARAKASEGSTRSALFSPDGRRLYIWGSTDTVTDQGEALARAIGLRVIDLKDGAIRAEGLVGRPISGVTPAPDGRSVYVYGFQDTGRTPGPYLLRRLEATTLVTLAEREFTGHHSFLFQRE